MSYRIAYIMSLPHSGSTLCGTLLGAHSASFCLGEPWKVRSYAQLQLKVSHKTALGNACTCGAPDIWQCTFWPKVDARVREASGMSLRELDTASKDPATFARDNKLLFDAVAAETGATLLVDSSKRAARLRALLDADFAAVTIVHLVRNPGGQVYSHMKRSGRGPYRHAVRNALDTLAMTRQAQKAETIFTTYEQIASTPEDWLRSIMPKLGLDFEARQLDWAHADRHNISGNRSRAMSVSTIKVDHSWETGLTPLRKAYINFVAGPFAWLAKARSQVP